MLARPADSVIQAQKFKTRKSEADRQCRREVKRVQRADGLRGERLTRSIHNLRADADQEPVRGGPMQPRPKVCDRRFADLSHRNAADQGALAGPRLAWPRAAEGSCRNCDLNLLFHRVGVELGVYWNRLAVFAQAL